MINFFYKYISKKYLLDVKQSNNIEIRKEAINY